MSEVVGKTEPVAKVTLEVTKPVAKPVAKPTGPKLSKQTMAEMEAGRASIAGR